MGGDGGEAMKESGGDGGATDSGIDMDGRGPIDRRGGWGGKIMTWGGEAVAGRETERGGVGTTYCRKGSRGGECIEGGEITEAAVTAKGGGGAWVRAGADRGEGTDGAGGIAGGGVTDGRGASWGEDEGKTTTGGGGAEEERRNRGRAAKGVWTSEYVVVDGDALAGGDVTRGVPACTGPMDGRASRVGTTNGGRDGVGTTMGGGNDGVGAGDGG